MTHWLRSFGLLLKWNVLRLRSELPLFMVIQTLISVGIVVGFSFVIPEIDPLTALYLTTGAMTVSLITVGMVVAPQIVAQQKERGLLTYQRTMPVPRLALLAADAIVWVVSALPGLAVTLGVAVARFRPGRDGQPVGRPGDSTGQHRCSRCRLRHRLCGQTSTRRADHQPGGHRLVDVLPRELPGRTPARMGPSRP